METNNALDAEILDKKEYINTNTDALILNGFVEYDVRWYLTAEVQINFIGLESNIDSLTFPYTMWAGDLSCEITKEQLQALCTDIMAFKTACLTSGKTLRDSLSSLSDEELVAFVDSRTEDSILALI